MLRWLLGPKCPVNVREKVWTDRRMNWLAEQFGIERMLQAEVILPTQDYFPDPYEGTPEDVRRILDRLCYYMRIDPGTIDLEFFTDKERSDAAGLYVAGERQTVAILDTQLQDPQALLATLVHELAHVLLLGGGLLTAETEDHEMVTDLLPLYLGLGVLSANAVLREAWSGDSYVYWWQAQKQGYLVARQYGYALGLFAWRRAEDHPPWKRLLRLDVREPFEQTLAYLRKTGDSFFASGSNSAGYSNIEQLAAALGHQSASIRLDALWSVQDFERDSADLVPAIATCLRHRDPIIRAEAAKVLAEIGPPASAAAPSLLALCYDLNDDVRASVATALGAIGSPSREVILELIHMLAADDWQIVQAAAQALGRIGTPGAEAGESLVDALRRAIIKCDSKVIDELAEALIQVTADPKLLVRKHFGYDSELYRLASDAVELHLRSKDQQH